MRKNTKMRVKKIIKTIKHNFTTVKKHKKNNIIKPNKTIKKRDKKRNAVMQPYPPYDHIHSNIFHRIF